MGVLDGHEAVRDRFNSPVLNLYMRDATLWF